MDYLKKFLSKKNLAILGSAFALVGLLIWNSHGSSEAEGWQLPTEQVPPTEAPMETVQLELVADVKGEVLQPGLYPFHKGDRVAKLIEAAGGLTERADVKQVNLAAVAEDAMVIFIPAVGESSVNNDPTATAEPEKKININTATKEQLEQIKGVGPSTADKIIQYRTEKGKFKKIEDLKKVSGIGDKTFEKLKSQIVTH